MPSGEVASASEDSRPQIQPPIEAAFLRLKAPMPLPTDFADLEPEDGAQQPLRTAKPQPTLNIPVSRIDLHAVHKAVNKLEMRHEQFEAKVDASIPGADFKVHWDHHARITEREIESKKLWAEVRKALLISFILLVAGAIGTGLWNYIKFSGGLLK